MDLKEKLDKYNLTEEDIIKILEDLYNAVKDIIIQVWEIVNNIIKEIDYDKYKRYLKYQKRVRNRNILYNK